MMINSRKSRSSTRSNHRRTIGYMTNGIYGQGGKGGFHFSLWKGIQETAKAHDVNVVSFIGGSFRISPSYQYEYQRNNVFDLISSESIDGLIISSTTLNSAISLTELSRYYSHFSPHPIVSIGIQLENFPSLFVDNRTGAREIVNHLIETHGYRRIAYIRGPEENEDAAVRYQAYLDSLREHGIPIDPDLILRGDFIRSSGESAAYRLLDENKTGFDAVVAANDNMALGVISALRSRGVVVPDQVAVVGFDDIPDAIMSFPSLTTVRQPIYELGEKVVELLLVSLNGGEMPPYETLPTRVAIRNSCGCSMQAAPTRTSKTVIAQETQKDSGPKRKTTLKKMVDALGCTIGQRVQAALQAGQLLDAISKAVEPGSQFDRSLNNLALTMNAVMEKGPLLPWHRAIFIVSQSRWPAIDCIKWQAIWQLTSEIAWFSQSFERLQEHYQDEEQSELVRGISQALVTTFNLPELMETIWRLLPRLGIEGCWISLYDQPGTSSQMARLKLAYDRTGKIDLPEEGRLYPARWLLPKDMMNFDRSFEVYVNSLYYGDTIFGFVIFLMDEIDQKILDMIASQISTALQGTKVVDDLQRMEAEFHRQANTDPLTGIYNRRMLYTLGEPAFELARRHTLPLSVAMIDIDNFKRVNDQFGHAVGDQVLCSLSRFIQTHIRGADIFGRFGGEEFVIVLPETSSEGAVFFVDRLRKSIQEHPFGIGELPIGLTISVGLSTLIHNQDQIIDNLIDKADKALYQAKQAGKNQVAIFGETHHTSIGHAT
jgi:diguanylate cyclase (GGDEF)-like protein